MAAALELAASARLHAMLALIWCGIYFTVAILLASGATVHARIPVQYAGLGEMVSVAPVILLAASAWAWRVIQRRAPQRISK
jgi:Cu2+-exporting ATPase